MLHPSDLEDNIREVDWDAVPRQSAVSLALTVDIANAAKAERVRRRDLRVLSRIIMVTAMITVLLGLLLGIPPRFVLVGILTELLVLHINNLVRDRKAKKRAKSIVEEAQGEVRSLARRFPA